MRGKNSPRDRSLVTVASLVTNSSTDQLRGHLARARANGLTEAELKEAIVHLAFYAGWPKAMSAITVAREVFAGPELRGSPSGWLNAESPVWWRGFRGVLVVNVGDPPSRVGWGVST
ncbi:carboxymuconolactone decarboxylase family protein [Paenarthrobacter ureafaciens]